MLTDTQIEQFFVEVLEFPNWRDVKSKDVMEFLREFIQRYQYFCYFHNTEMASTPPDQRRVPNEADSTRIGLAGKGGVCLHHNYFATLLLQSLGFNSYTSGGNCQEAIEAEGEHCMCILKLNETEIYAIDVGSGQALGGPIPLHNLSLHNLPFSGIAAGFRYEYRFNESTQRYERWHLDGTYFRGKFDDPNKRQLRYTFSIIPRDFDYFSETLLNVFTNAEKSIFLKAPFLFRCLDLLESECGDNGRRYILIFGASMVIYDNVNRQVTDFTSYKELKPHILKYFPKVDPAVLDKALEYFTINCKELILGREC